MANYNILTEVPPISKQDSFVVFERRKSNFNFPIHIHSEYELNYIIGARGARRIVGDHVADIGDREMVLITGSNLEHAWMDGNLAPGAEIYEVTIQFSPELFQGSGLIDRKQFAPIKKMLQDAQHGIAFSEKTILQSESGIHQLINSTDNFNSILIFLSLLNQLAQQQRQYFIRYEKALPDLALEIAGKVMEHAIQTDPLVLEPLVQRAVAQVKNAEWLEVQISQQLPELAQELRKELQEWTDARHVEVTTDQNELGACVVHTPQGIIDASVSTQLDNLNKRLHTPARN